MQPGSLVEHIGGQDPIGKQMYELKKEVVYTVSWVGESIFSGVRRSAISLEEIAGFEFVVEMFREIQPPIEINIDEIIKQST